MKYSLIEIRPTITEESRWRVGFDDTDPYDRVSCKKYIPNAGLGFFYFPRKWKTEKAFEILKEEMIKVRQKEIEYIQRDIDDIKNIQLPEWAIK